MPDKKKVGNDALCPINVISEKEEGVLLASAVENVKKKY